MWLAARGADPAARFIMTATPHNERGTTDDRHLPGQPGNTRLRAEDRFRYPRAQPAKVHPAAGDCDRDWRDLPALDSHLSWRHPADCGSRYERRALRRSGRSTDEGPAGRGRLAGYRGRDRLRRCLGRRHRWPSPVRLRCQPLVRRRNRELLAQCRHRRRRSLHRGLCDHGARDGRHPRRRHRVPRGPDHRRHPLERAPLRRWTAPRPRAPPPPRLLNSAARPRRVARPTQGDGPSLLAAGHTANMAVRPLGGP
jgi:hypothetical protein